MSATLSTFYSDMNRHANADYGKVSEWRIAELETHGATLQRDPRFTLTIWEVYRPDGNPVEPNNSDNRYEWFGRARATFSDEQESREAFKAIKRTKKAEREFIDEHPYDGPRSIETVRVWHSDE